MSSEDPNVVSPYLQRPLRTLEQALKDCGRAREQTARIVTLPRGPGADGEHLIPGSSGNDSSVFVPERFGATA